MIGATVRRALTHYSNNSPAAGVVEFILSADNLSVNKHNVYMYERKRRDLGWKLKIL